MDFLVAPVQLGLRLRKAPAPAPSRPGEQLPLSGATTLVAAAGTSRRDSVTGKG